MAARIALLAALVACALAAPARAAGDRCPRAPAGPPFSAFVDVDYATEESDPERSALIVCNRRTGRARVLRRATLTRTGRRVVAASVAGRRVAWLEAVVGRRRSAFVVIVARARDGRRLQRRYVLDRAPYEAFDYAGVGLTTRGDLAWTVGARPEDMRVVLAAPGAAPRELARGSVSGLGVDDDATLMWGRHVTSSLEPEVVAYDLPGRDLGAGCPRRRSRFTEVRRSSGIVHTRSTRGGGESSSGLLRACDEATGLDRIVATSFSADPEFETIEPRGGGAGWAVLSLHETSRYDQCGVVTLYAIEIASGRVGRAVTRSGCRRGLIDGFPLAVVTASGTPAFVEDGALWAASAEMSSGRNVLAELDRGDIRDLRAEGEDLVWTNGGEPRRARP